MKRRARHIVAFALLVAAGCTQNQSQQTATKAASPGATATGPSVELNPPGGIVLGANWYPIESYGGETFRWARNDAEITACPDSADRTLAMMLEPGPGIGSKVAHLTIRGNRGDSAAIALRGRQYAKVDIARGAPGETFAIHADSRNLPSPNRDPRILNYRLLEATLGFSTASCPNDIARDGTLAVGKGWYPYESYAGNTFRWVNNNAQAIVTAAHSKPFAVELDVAPGPSLGGMPLALTASTGGKVVGKAPPVRTRQVINIAVPPAPAGTRLVLSTRSKNAAAPHDPRTLNFQVFSLTIQP